MQSRERIKDLIREAGRPLTGREVAERTGAKPASVKSLMHQMASDGQLERAGRERKAEGQAGAPAVLFALPDATLSQLLGDPPAEEEPEEASPFPAPLPEPTGNGGPPEPAPEPEPAPAPSPAVESAEPAAPAAHLRRRPRRGAAEAGSAAGPSSDTLPGDGPPPALVTFIYLLQRDLLPFGAVRALLNDATAAVQASGGRSPRFTSVEAETLARRYAEALVEGRIISDACPSEGVRTVRGVDSRG